MASTQLTRQLGKDGPQVTALGFGAMGLSAFYGPTAPDEERLEFLDHVYAQGEKFWDSSDIYGDSEELIGKWFHKSGKRDDIFLATKFAIASDSDGNRITRNDPEYIKQAAAKSLSRLSTKYIDLYYCHRIDSNQPIETTVKAMAELVQEGKVKYLGLSEVSSETLRRACKVHHIAAVQMEYSPFAMDIEDPKFDLLKTCQELGVAVVAYSPLGRGFLTGRYKSPDDFPEGDFRKFAPRYSQENFANNYKIVDALQELAKAKGVTAGQLTLAWLMAQWDGVIPIPGTTQVKNFDENMASLHVKLTGEENAKIRKAVESAEVFGERYPAAFTASLFADTAPLA